MTVVLVGIAADSKNTNPMGPVHDDGRFEYIPIPESVEGTSEERTYGTENFRFDEKKRFANYVKWIKPAGDDQRKKDSAEDIESHPLHYDPEFNHLTYGESGGRPEYIERLEKLQPDVDAVAFYAGLLENGRKHRYLIGYFTVNEVVDIPAESGKDRADIFEEHPHNAHAKRYFGTGESKHDELVIVDGQKPANLLDTATVKMSSYDRFGAHQYYLADEFVEEFPLDDPTYTHDPDSNSKEDKVWLGFKKPLRVGLSASEFIARVESYGES